MIASASLCLSGCAGIFARYVVLSPNAGKTLQVVSREQPLALPGTVIDHRLRIDIAEPAPASLSVWVIDPSNERLVDSEATPFPLFEPTDDRPRTTHPPRGTILIAHGFHDQVNEVRYLRWARIFAAEGYRAVLIDMRGHGHSTGNWSTYGVVEARDMMTVLDTLESRGLLVQPVGAAAMSFSASTLVRLADTDDRVDALALISTFTNMRDVIPDYGRAIGFDMFSDAQYTRIIDSAGEQAGFDPDDADLISRLGRLDTPVLLFHGENDALIPILHAVRLYEAADSATVELIRIKGVGHTTLGGDVVEPIRVPMLAWFERYLFAEPVAAQRRAEQRTTAQREMEGLLAGP